MRCHGAESDAFAALRQFNVEQERNLMEASQQWMGNHILHLVWDEETQNCNSVLNGIMDFQNFLAQTRHCAEDNVIMVGSLNWCSLSPRRDYVQKCELHTLTWILAESDQHVGTVLMPVHSDYKKMVSVA